LPWDKDRYGLATVSHYYRLAEPKNQKSLLKSLASVRTPEQALQWIKTNGSPFPTGMELFDASLNLNELVLMASGLRWLLELIGAIKAQDALRLGKWKQDRQDFKKLFEWPPPNSMSVGENCYVSLTDDDEDEDEEEDEDASQKESDGQAAVDEEDYLERCRRMDLDMLGRNAHSSIGLEKDSVHILFSPVELSRWTGVYWYDTNQEMLHLVPIADLVVSFKNETWQSSPDAYLLRAAQAYVIKALDYLLIGIHPTMKWEQKGRVGNYVSSLRVSCPVDAASLALYNQFSATSPLRKCINPTCEELFAPARRNKIFCDKAACRKAVSREKQRTKVKTLQTGIQPMQER